ncbi:hypothetical protein [Moritella viscosa]|uniref:Uncharacterized protein n=1 Tax=Moritella viscosa TaxID=80854 RepID=A0ABY1HDY1_9GAMM|nr:hypothetical protein [Moritella viscosa]SGY93149.1 Putative uncharacterized protein [Moritella viscosa]SHO28236.1 Uncharacterized protein ydiJ [Moritella viscosa]
MSNHLIEQFSFEQLCRVVEHKNGKQYCYNNGIIYSDLHNKFKELSQTVIDNTNYHIIFNDEYYLSDITSFLAAYINDSQRNIDLAVTISTLQNINYLDAILEQFNAKDSIELYEQFSDFFDTQKTSENGRELILLALSEQYLLLEDDISTIDDFISEFLQNSNYIQKIKNFFNENYNIEDFTDESISDCLLSCFEDNYRFEKQIFSYSEQHDFNTIEQQLNELENELKQDGLSNKNKLKKGF